MQLVAWGSEINENFITISLLQGSTFSPYLFAQVMDVLAKLIQEDVPWCILYANGIVLVGEIRSESQVRNLVRHFRI